MAKGKIVKKSVHNSSLLDFETAVADMRHKRGNICFEKIRRKMRPYFRTNSWGNTMHLYNPRIGFAVRIVALNDAPQNGATHYQIFNPNKPDAIYNVWAVSDKELLTKIIKYFVL